MGSKGGGGGGGVEDKVGGLGEWEVEPVAVEDQRSLH